MQAVKESHTAVKRPMAGIALKIAAIRYAGRKTGFVWIAQNG